MACLLLVDYCSLNYYVINREVLLKKTSPRKREELKRGDNMTIEEAIKTAIEFEIKIRDIYSEAAVGIEDEVGKRIFETLSNDEQRHIDYLQFKLKQLENTGEITVERLETAIPSQEIINQQADQLKPLAVKDFHGIKQQMLSKALKIEIDTIEFYQRMAEELSDEGQALFKRFLEIENNHINAVQFELDYLSKTGYWFDFKEFDME
jgi:rubrerythrin